MNPIIRLEQALPVAKIKEVAWIAADWARVEVGNLIRALCCTIRDPGLSTVCAVIRREQNSPVIESDKVCRGGSDIACLALGIEAARVAAAWTGVDVDQQM